MSGKPSLYLALVAVAAAGAGGVWWFRHWQERQAVEQVLGEIEALLAEGEDQDWSRLVARLEGLAAEPRRVAVLRAHIEFARGRSDRAAERLAPLLAGGGATTAEWRLAAEVWLDRFARIGRTRTEQREIGRQALEFAERAAGGEGSARDLFRAWQAAVRLPDDAAQQRFAAELQAAHPGSLEARTVALIGAFQGGGEALPEADSLAAEWDAEPVELALLRGVGLLATGASADALRMLDPLLESAPNLVEVRNWVATAHHAVGLSLPADDPGRVRHLAVRDAQLDWLDANAAADDSRRVRWLQLRQLR